MADAPRSILAWLGGPHQGLSFAGGPSGKEIEYIRADVARADAELAVAEVQRLRGTDETCAKCDAKGEDCGEHVPTWADLAAVWKARAEKAEAELERLLYVLDGVAGAIDTGRNEPLQVWRDQINIARQALKGQTND